MNIRLPWEPEDSDDAVGILQGSIEDPWRIKYDPGRILRIVRMLAGSCENLLRILGGSNIILEGS